MTDLPSLDQPQAYVVVGPDDQRGPYTLELLVSEVVAGRLHDATPVWWPGLADWTTMTGHAGLAAEIQRRRSPGGASAFSPPTPQTPAAQPVPHQTESAGYGQSGSGYPVAAPAGQDYSTDMYSGYGAPAQRSEQQAVQDPFASVTPVDGPPQTTGAPATAEDSTVLMGEVVPVEVTGGEEADVPATGPFGRGEGDDPLATEQVVTDTGDVLDVEPVHLTSEDLESADAADPMTKYDASGPAMGLDPRDASVFSDLLARSRARAEAIEVVVELNDDVIGAVEDAGRDSGLEHTGTSGGTDQRTVAFRGGDDLTLEVTVGQVTGHELARRDGHFDLQASCHRQAWQGVAAGGSGEHGEIVVAAARWGGGGTAEVSLLLPLADYLRPDLSCDTGAVRRDATALMAALRAALD